jgi:hypothetical protein
MHYLQPGVGIPKARRHLRDLWQSLTSSAPLVLPASCWARGNRSPPTEPVLWVPASVLWVAVSAWNLGDWAPLAVPSCTPTRASDKSGGGELESSSSDAAQKVWAWLVSPHARRLPGSALMAEGAGLCIRPSGSRGMHDRAPSSAASPTCACDWVSAIQSAIQESPSWRKHPRWPTDSWGAPAGLGPGSLYCKQLECRNWEEAPISH